MQTIQQFASSVVPASYAESPVVHSVEFWTLVIAAGLVFIEWLASRR